MRIGGVVAVGVLGASLSIQPARAQEGGGKLVHLKGKVDAYSVKADTWTKANEGRLLIPKDAVRTGADGWAALLLMDETLVHVNRKSLLTLVDVESTAGWLKKRLLPAALTRRRSLYRLESGEVWLRNKNPDASIELRTPTVSAAVRGTELDVVVADDLTVTLTVLEGRVSVWTDRESMDVVAGEELTARPGSPLTKRILLTPSDAVQSIVPVPPLMDHTDLPLVSSDRELLDQELARLEAEVAARPTDEARVRLAEVYRDRGSSRQAIDLFQQVLGGDPRNSRALTGLGWARLDRGMPEAALAAFTTTSEPEPINFVGRSVAYRELGEAERAAQALEDGATRFPEAAIVKVEQANLLLRSGRVVEAKASLSGLTSDESLAWSFLGLANLILGDKESALEATQQGVEATPGSPTAWILRSYAHQAAFNLDAAQEATENALSLDPDHVMALTQLAKLRFGMGYQDEAWKLAQRAKSLAPGDAEVQNLLGFLELARPDIDRAMESFQQAARLDPGLGEPHLGLALALMRRGRVEEALEEMTTAVLLEPRRALFLSYWGKMLFQIRRFSRALDIFQMAEILDPQDPTPLLYRAIILRDLNRFSESISAMNAAIERNDNRAVYRSRFLLDSDLAVKNVVLSILYDQLGLDAWAFRKATASVKYDYMNSAGHLFLGGALQGIEGRNRAADSELLLGRLLQPANLNTFNQFNEYTSFFDRPNLSGTASLTAGSHGTYIGWLPVFGGLPSANLAFSGYVHYQKTDGWRETNHVKALTMEGAVKWEPFRRHNILVQALKQNGEGGEFTRPHYDYYKPPVDPSEHNEGHTDKLNLGYHFQPSPRTDLLFVFTRTELDGDLVFRNEQPLNFFFGPLEGWVQENHFTFSWGTPKNQIQGQFQYRRGNHQLIAGTVHYWGRFRLDGDVESIWVGSSGLRLPIDSYRIEEDLPDRFHSVYVQDTWHVAPSLDLEAALYYDDIEYNDFFQGTVWTRAEVDPRLGMIWRPTDGDTIRVAAFRYVLPHWSARIDPSDVAGITIFRNSWEGSVTSEADLAWEHEWSSGLLLADVFYLDREFELLEAGFFEPELVTAQARMRGAEVAFNQLFSPGIGLAARYRYFDVEDEQFPVADRDDHWASIGLNFVHPSGFSAGVEETYRFADLVNEDRNDEPIWLTDLQARYEFPGRRGSLSFVAQNVFDRKFNWVIDEFVFIGRIPSRQLFVTFSYNF